MIETAHARVVDVVELQIARVYADAIWTAACSEGDPLEIVEEFESLIADVLDKQPMIRVYFQHISAHHRNQAAFLERVFKGRCGPLMYNSMLTLSRRGRLGLVRPIARRLRELYDESKKRTSVLVRSAVALEESELESIRELVRKRLGREPVLTAQVDPSLLGGVWIRVGDRVFDSTVRHNLRKLRENILARSTHEVQS